MRPYTGPDDLRLMQGLAQRLWSHRSQWHIGDLVWQRFQHLGREPEWPTALWEVDGRVVAWGWVREPGGLAYQVDPDFPDLAAEVVAWGEPEAVWLIDGEEHLVPAGFTAREVRSTHMSRSLAGLPEPVLPPGFRVGPVDDVAARVACHRSVWRPSRVTEESYRVVMGAWPYERSLDQVVVASDGTVAAQCLVWADEVNAVGELEPVGTVESFRRLGLGRAVCLAAMRAAAERGCAEAVVYPVTGWAQAFYRSLGFTPYARTRAYRP
ncbi:GNAT family N-acetyltransferase [Actinokineospora pegani]|uniref:GNAT family N-acetyltransferase n=1 Tax=Actinokineospora pegani TaxID=2654637 RepID=UPI0012EAD1DD|nr:GNAT family N-acetyltransferase [Actinokineospora pegani]